MGSVAISLATHRSDCPAELRRALDEHPIVPWYRTQPYARVSHRMIAQRVAGAWRAEDTLHVPGEDPLARSPLSGSLYSQSPLHAHTAHALSPGVCSLSLSLAQRSTLSTHTTPGTRSLPGVCSLSRSLGQRDHHSTCKHPEHAAHPLLDASITSTQFSRRPSPPFLRLPRPCLPFSSFFLHNKTH